jgi:Galactose mutarotase and related enzymes
MMRRAGLALILPMMLQSANYTAERVTIDNVEVIRLRDAAAQTEVLVAPSFGNNAYEMTVKGKRVFWSPYNSIGELKAKPTLAGNPFLAPWANRLDQDAFYANGQKYFLNPDLGNLRRDGNGKPIHGLLVFAPEWRVTNLRSSDNGAEVTSRLDFTAVPQYMAQFPFAHSIEMTYRLSRGALEVETVIHNQSSQPMPLAIGFHPYYQINDAPRDEWTVGISARDHVVLSNLLIPTGERKPVSLPNPLSLANTQLDDVFTNLIRDDQGNAEFWVKGRQEKISVVFGPKYQVAVIYAPKGRNFICFEPMTGLTNAFNLAHAGLYKELQQIAPGATWRESFQVRVSGF